MFTRSRSAIAALATTVLLAACSNDVTAPSQQVAFAPRLQGGVTDTSLVGGGGGGVVGGGSSSGSCGTLSANITTYNIVVYTTRIGIGFSGAAYNCGTRNEAFDVEVMDVNPDPICHVNVPHFVAAKNTSPGLSQFWSANSTLVNCMKTTHTFVLTLIDTKTGQTLDTKTVSAFL